jgi:hypothetical protein
VSSNLTAPTILQITIADFRFENSSRRTENLVMELRSIVKPFDLAELFLKTQPAEMERASGDASFCGV